MNSFTSIDRSSCRHRCVSTVAASRDSGGLGGVVRHAAWRELFAGIQNILKCFWRQNSRVS